MNFFRYKAKNGHSLAELGMSVFIFSFILITILALLNVGLKYWHLGEISVDTQQAVEVSISRLISELKFSNASTCLYDPSMEFISFDTALNNGKVEYDFYSQTPIWQTYIIYYTYNEGSVSGTKTLYRRIVPHISYPLPQIFNPASDPDYLTGKQNVSGNSGEHLKIVAKNIKKFEVTGENNLISVRIIGFKSMGEGKLAYEQDFNKNIGAHIEVTNSVSPRN